MTDNELLLAISSMIDPLREDFNSMKEDLNSMKEDLNSMKKDLNSVKNDLNSVKEDMQETKERVKKVELTLENKVLPRLNTIEACYISTFNRYKEHVETYDSMKQDIYIIKKVVAEHSEKLQKLA